jgi:hypothetical protein
MYRFRYSTTDSDCDAAIIQDDLKRITVVNIHDPARTFPSPQSVHRVLTPCSRRSIITYAFEKCGIASIAVDCYETYGSVPEQDENPAITSHFDYYLHCRKTDSDVARYLPLPLIDCMVTLRKGEDVLSSTASTTSIYEEHRYAVYTY